MADVKQYTRKEVGERSGGAETVFIIDNEVFDVSAFLDEHPGGHEVLVHARGADASEEFHDVGHSFDAKELMRKYRVGELVPEDRVALQQRQLSWEQTPSSAETSFLSSWKFPLLMGVLMTLLYSYLLG